MLTVSRTGASCKNGGGTRRKEQRGTAGVVVEKWLRQSREQTGTKQKKAKSKSKKRKKKKRATKTPDAHQDPNTHTHTRVG